MKTLTEFKQSLNLEKPDNGLPVQLKSLWYDCKGNWHQAHAQVDQLNDTASAWVHATCIVRKGIFGMPITGIKELVKSAQIYLWKMNGSNWYYNLFKYLIPLPYTRTPFF